MIEKYFKNRQTGNILVIKNCFLDVKQIIYNLFDNPMDYKNDIALERATFPLNITFLPEIPLEFDNLIEWLQLRTIEDLYPDFDEVAKVEYWDFETGSTSAEITTRVVIPNDLIAKNITTGSPLDQLINAMSYLSDWTTKGKNSVVQYLEELLPQHEAILKEYPQIFIEVKPKLNLP